MSVEKYSLFPVQDDEIFKLGKAQLARFWTVEDFKSFNLDRRDYLNMSPNMQKVIEKVLTLFLPFDGVVNKGHMRRTIDNSVNQSEQYAMAFQIAIEAVHAETYGLVAREILGIEKMLELKKEAETVSCIQKKIAFMEKYSSEEYSYNEYLLAFACSEGILISVSFIFIFWFRSQGLMYTLVLANAMISEDEEIHQKMAVQRYLKREGLSEERVLEIINEAKEIEEEYIDWVLPKPVKDLNREDVKTYLKLVVDYQLVMIGYPKRYNVSNPFPWDFDRSLYKKPNPYERESSQYCKFSLNESSNTNEEKRYQNPWEVEGI